ncbi:MAG: PHP domain-containing protein [Pseudomonadales bacterium]|jgi:predicted metal-dependent phosphoesterase TrpH|nr:PHP domain-containing protein [Pseudomonadales bacterium]MDP7596050.1 PHP domain-containing protein [Pseudomonadales bacterium]HJN50223.1 PHP domain-containing protein [Pseudomonadales bacterium]|tara:strand:- start:3370 stop:4074 length:705 start_codon:yes stop_codon:yes gene_type:complete
MLIDLHNHTGWGSGCSHLEPSVLIERAQRWGLDGVAITEHNQLWDPGKIEMLRRRYDFVVLAGVEVDTDVGHVLAFGLQGPRRWTQLPTLEELRDLVDEVHGALVVAHPFRDPRINGLDRGFGKGEPELERLGIVDAVEVHNGLAGENQREQATEMAELLGLPTTGGSDTHRFMDVGTSFTVFEDDIGDEQALVAAIKAGRCHGGDWTSEGLMNKRMQELSAPGRNPIQASRGA